MDKQLETKSPSLERSNYQKIRSILLKVMIICFSASAILGILLVLLSEVVDSDFAEFFLKLISTLLIVGALALFSMNNFTRLVTQDKIARIFPKAALVSNLFWAIPWILLVWGVMDLVGRAMGWCVLNRSWYYYSYSYYDCSRSYYDFISIVWRLVGVAVTISLCCTILSNFLVMKKSTPAISILQKTTITLTSILGIYVLCCIIADKMLLDDCWQLLAVMAIIEIFGLVVTPILAKVHKSQEMKQALRAQVAPSIDEQKLRAEIEQEVRAKILAEQQAAAQPAKPEPETQNSQPENSSPEL